ncbi:MAG: ATP-binding protein [bacterium]|nr:ATP-binding protein [bacterium]
MKSEIINPTPFEKGAWINPFKWISIFRITAVTVIVGIGIFFLHKQHISIAPLCTLIGITYLLTTGYWICFKKEKFIRFVLWSNVVLDVLIITGVVHYTGGIESELTFLYFFPIVAASIFFFLKGGMWIATFCIPIYGGILMLEFYKIINPIFPLFTKPDPNALYLKLYLQATFFYLVAATSGYIAERFKRRGEVLEQIRLDTNTILQGMNSGLIVVDTHYNVLYKNEIAEKILDCQVKDGLHEIVEKMPEFGQWITRLLNEKLQERFQKITIGAKIIGINISWLQDKRGVILVLQDLTEVEITERLAAIGKFSSDLAHEIRNPIAAIQGSCELIKEGINDEEKTRLFDVVLKEAQHLNNIVTNFLSFAKPTPLNPKSVEVGELINDAVKLAKGCKGHSERSEESNGVTVKITQKLPLWLKLDKEQMKIAFLNLIINALQAMDGEGKLQIEVTHPGNKYSLLKEERIATKSEAVITFKDTGPGIQDSNLPHIFTPFYTTKKGGTGLGLSIVSKIIEAHRGKIEVRSEVGEGTVFAIHLPYII